MKNYFKFLFLILASIAFAALAITYVPWKAGLEYKLERILNKKGFKDADVILTGFGLHEAYLQDITIGQDKPLRLKDLKLRYSLKDLLQSNLREIEINGLVIEVKKIDGKWRLQGYDPITTNVSSSALLLPTTKEAISSILFENMIIKESQVNAITDTWNLTAPLEAEWHKNTSVSIVLKSQNPQLSYSDISAQAAKANLQAAYDDKLNMWKGEWELVDIEFPSYPVIQAHGTIQLNEELAYIEGQFQSADKIYSAQFSLKAPFAQKDTAVLNIERAQVLWKKGTLTTRNIIIPLSGDKPIKFVLHANKISVDEVLQAMTGKRVSATGLISGELPVSVGRDGSITFHQGKLQSVNEGTISLPEEILPGDNPQVKLTRDILKNFHYKSLVISFKNSPNGDLTLVLALNGSNPDLYKGRPVKLNVNLSGDILDFVQKNVIFIHNPAQLLQQDTK